MVLCSWFPGLHAFCLFEKCLPAHIAMYLCISYVIKPPGFGICSNQTLMNMEWITANSSSIINYSHVELMELCCLMLPRLLHNLQSIFILPVMSLKSCRAVLQVLLEAKKKKRSKHLCEGGETWRKKVCVWMERSEWVCSVFHLLVHPSFLVTLRTCTWKLGRLIKKRGGSHLLCCWLLFSLSPQ